MGIKGGKITSAEVAVELKPLFESESGGKLLAPKRTFRVYIRKAGAILSEKNEIAGIEDLGTFGRPAKKALAVVEMPRFTISPKKFKYLDSSDPDITTAAKREIIEQLAKKHGITVEWPTN